MSSPASCDKIKKKEMGRNYGSYREIFQGKSLSYYLSEMGTIWTFDGHLGWTFGCRLSSCPALRYPPERGIQLAHFSAAGWRFAERRNLYLIPAAQQPGNQRSHRCCAQRRRRQRQSRSHHFSGYRPYPPVRRLCRPGRRCSADRRQYRNADQQDLPFRQP